MAPSTCNQNQQDLEFYIIIVVLKKYIKTKNIHDHDTCSYRTLGSIDMPNDFSQVENL